MLPLTVSVEVMFVYGPRHESACMSTVRLPGLTFANFRDTARRTDPFWLKTGDGLVAECHSTESVNGPCMSHSSAGASGRAALAIMMGPAVLAPGGYAGGDNKPSVAVPFSLQFRCAPLVSPM